MVPIADIPVVKTQKVYANTGIVPPNQVNTQNYKSSIPAQTGIGALIEYVVDRKPSDSAEFLRKYMNGYAPMYPFQIKAQIFTVLQAGDEAMLVDFLSIHPDKDMLIDLYKKGKIGLTHHPGCGCSKCTGIRRNGFFTKERIIAGGAIIVLLGLLIYFIIKSRR